MYTNDSCSHDCFHCAESFDQKEDPNLRCRVKGGLPVADDGCCDDWKPKPENLQ